MSFALRNLATKAFLNGRAAMSRSFHMMGGSSIVSRTALMRPVASGVTLPGAQKRYLNLHEYQSKALMNDFGVRVQRGQVAATAEEALEAAKKLKADNAIELICKAQIHAGGRGKGHFDTGFKGGVKICNTPEEVQKMAKEMLGHRLITKQTDSQGQPVQKVLIHEGVNFKRELYFAILMDRAYDGPVLVVSPKGGMDIEEVAHSDPGAIHTMAVDIYEGITQKHIDFVNKVYEFTGDVATDAGHQVRKLYNLFIGCDATQVEINPLVLATDGKVYCVDSKINFDDNASFRHKEIFDMRDFSMEDPREAEAAKYNLNYIGLDGNIACMVNGAGLAMATMDIIKLHGGSPANFLDVGGGANEEQVKQAFTLLSNDKKVKAILVNIFGGIMKCDTIANGVVAAAKKIGLKVPLIVRLEGTNVEKGVKILNDSGINVITARNLDDAAKKAVAAI